MLLSRSRRKKREAALNEASLKEKVEKVTEIEVAKSPKKEAAKKTTTNTTKK